MELTLGSIHVSYPDQGRGGSSKSPNSCSRRFIIILLCLIFFAVEVRRADDRAVATAAAVATKRQSTIECLDRLPKWMLSDHGDLLGEEFKVRSGGLTDKSTSHVYQLMYHRYLAPIGLRGCIQSPDELPKFRMLEIGLGCAQGGGMIRGEPGGSTRAWRQLFPEGAFELDLHVMEYDAACANKWAEGHPGIATQVHTGDASSAEDLDRVVRESGGMPFDMILDDASHVNWHQIFTLQHMIKHVARGGIYVIEDIQSSCHRWRANTGTEASELLVQGTPGCMETADGKPTIFAKLVEWQKPLLTKGTPFEDVTHIDIGYEAAVISKRY